jgi:phosphoribosylformylglycinamidine synthase
MLDLSDCADLAALPADSALFSESNGRFVITVKPADAEGFEKALAGQPCRRIGTVTEAPRLVAKLGDGTALDSDLTSLRAAYKEPLSHA